jgi:hypothetical protein
MPIIDSNKSNSVIETTANLSDAVSNYSVVARDISGDVYEIAETLLTGEKLNAKEALQQLWNLKKGLDSKEGVKTVDMLIAFYQEKIDLLRTKENRIKESARESSKLLKEKSSHKIELAEIKSKSKILTAQLVETNIKLEIVQRREQELELLELKISKELAFNDSNVLNGLSEIILLNDDKIISNPESIVKKSSDKVEIPAPEKSIKQISTFPVSIVKNGKGEAVVVYYYDPSSPTKQYICNSKYFNQKLKTLLPSLKRHDTVSAVTQMIRDIIRRSSGDRGRICFENSVNEIFNIDSLQKLMKDIVGSNESEVKLFLQKLDAKLTSLGDNYLEMLEEQFKNINKVS